ncbi:hypothetical protein [Nesterenkonia sphaerica]|uniref:Uncharacterized protein n=1 Tax=Nesterenkonia sphaerica TaxID=1804988 RepID=A0A5R9A5Y7_9MICC|nr:hypothetical protein [Nesterenkonia sphaerica]TLP74091.1 hypothetical protein FEF27_10095 [Nesterenkonia sphaerica]
MSATPPPGQPTTPPPPKPQQPSQKKQRPELDDDASRSYARLIGWLVLALVIAYAGLQMPLPWRLVTIAASVVGVSVAVFLLVRSIRRRLPVTLMVGALVFVTCFGFFLLTAAFQAVFWEASVQFDECLRSAVTERSTARCYDTYEQDMLNSIPGLR